MKSDFDLLQKELAIKGLTLSEHEDFITLHEKDMLIARWSSHGVKLSTIKDTAEKWIEDGEK